MWANLLPAGVPFDGVQWREHTGLGMGAGHLAIESGRIHAPTGVAYNPANNQPVDQLSQTWITVFANPGAWGFNWIGRSTPSIPVSILQATPPPGPTAPHFHSREFQPV